MGRTIKEDTSEGSSVFQGYESKCHEIPTKRYCQTLDLRDDDGLIQSYRELHSKEQVWKEVLDGIRQCGILEMEIYILGTRLFMIVETPLDFCWKTAMSRLAGFPRQAEWEALTAKYQKADATASSGEKWKLMERIFHLYSEGE